MDHNSGTNISENNTNKGKKMTIIPTISSSSSSSSPPPPSSLSLFLSSSSTSSSEAAAVLLLGERVLALWDVSEGMKYLHSHRILFRDLKTENVCSTTRTRSSLGRTDTTRSERSNGTSESIFHTYHEKNHQHQPHQQQRMQIFDFGLAKECKSIDRITSRTSKNIWPRNRQDLSSFYDTYRMTGLTGTLRIMAPEVIQCIPYGLSADAYSFGICMWEVFQGSKCEFLSPADICCTRSNIKGGHRSIRSNTPSSYYNERKENNNNSNKSDDGKSTTENNNTTAKTNTNTKTVREQCTKNIGIGVGIAMPKQLQNLMEQCWNDNPYERPTFHEISDKLKLILSELFLLHNNNNNKGVGSCLNNTITTTSVSSLSSSSSSSRNNNKSQQQQQHLPPSGQQASGASLAAAFWYRLETIHSS